ncbi:MAG: hypothetical protein ACYDHM_07665 [Acidiferrobacterales bacterium]
MNGASLIWRKPLALTDRVARLERLMMPGGPEIIFHIHSPIHEGHTASDKATRALGESLPAFLSRAREAWTPSDGLLHIELADDDLPEYEKWKRCLSTSVLLHLGEA